ncbi:MAG: PPE domain-containing protein [Pseudonocardiaceae bacterium]
MSGAWDVVADVLGFGGGSGNDHGSSNWAAWGHPEIRSMLDTSVDPGDISDAASAWRDQGRNTTDSVTGLTRDLHGIVVGGWRGRSADAALAALDPINQWSAGQAEIAERTTELMGASGSCAGRAKATVPQSKSFDWGESLSRLAVGGVPGAVVDAVAQEQQQAQEHAEAVRIMTSVYSAPINDYRATVPTYPQLADPMLQPPDQPPKSGPAPGYSGGGAATLAGGHVAHPPATPMAHAPSTPIASAPLAHPLSAPTAHPQPVPTALQNVTSAVPAPYRAGQLAPDQGTHQPQQVGGEVAAAAAGVPVVGQIAGDARRARAASGVRLGGGGAGGYPGGGGQLSRGGQLSGGQVRGGGRAGAGHPVEFGPRPSAVAQESRMGSATGVAAGRVNPGEMMAPMVGGRGPGGEDTEHRRPSYLIEMDDVFADGRKVAPAVIGEDQPEQDD